MPAPVNPCVALFALGGTIAMARTSGTGVSPALSAAGRARVTTSGTPGLARAAPWSYWRVKTAWTMMVLFIDVMRIGFYVRPKSARLTGTSASSRTSSLAADIFASKESGRVWPRTVRLPVTRTPPLAAWMPSTV